MVVDIGGVNLSFIDDKKNKFGKSYFLKVCGVMVIVIEDVIIIWGYVLYNLLKIRIC